MPRAPVVRPGVRDRRTHSHHSRRRRASLPDVDATHPKALEHRAGCVRRVDLHGIDGRGQPGRCVAGLLARASGRGIRPTQYRGALVLSRRSAHPQCPPHGRGRDPDASRRRARRLHLHCRRSGVRVVGAIGRPLAPKPVAGDRYGDPGHHPAGVSPPA